ncbi:outer membrane beta-barrel protein, partial [Xanthovirga aplysinae]|uniref:outer membrane beta-barrel protein n=1 Tax=Xanthovirga aplysinae TaxID=2529853 RepID=UPI0012BD696F
MPSFIPLRTLLILLFTGLSHFSLAQKNSIGLQFAYDYQERHYGDVLIEDLLVKPYLYNDAQFGIGVFSQQQVSDRIGLRIEINYFPTRFFYMVKKPNAPSDYLIGMEFKNLEVPFTLNYAFINKNWWQISVFGGLGFIINSSSKQFQGPRINPPLTSSSGK